VQSDRLRYCETAAYAGAVHNRRPSQIYRLSAWSAAASWRHGKHVVPIFIDRGARKIESRLDKVTLTLRRALKLLNSTAHADGSSIGSLFQSER